MSLPPGVADHLRLAGGFHLLHVIILPTTKLAISSLTRDYVHANHILSVFLYFRFYLFFSPFFLPACDNPEDLNPADVSYLI